MPHQLNKLFLAILIGGFFALQALQANAQSVANARNLEITFNKTSSLIFPAGIIDADRGSRDVLAQKAKEVENVLHLKAARPGFPETNLTVITADGKLYHFTINYSSSPSGQTIEVDPVPDAGPALIFKTLINTTEMGALADKIIASKRSVKGIGQKKTKMHMTLNGIYIVNDLLFYHLRLSNNSNIRYDLDFARFYIRDKQKVKRTATQEIEMKPVYTHNTQNVVEGNSSADMVYALDKFTIPDSKHLVIEMFERNGGRNLSLRIKHKTIMKAKPVPPTDRPEPRVP